MHACIHTYIHTYIYIHTYTYIHTLTYIHIHTYIYLHTYTYIHTLTYIHTYTHTDIHTYIHTHTDIHTYIHTQTYIHTYMQAEVPSQSDPRSMGFVDQRRDIHGKPWKTCKMIKHGGRDSIHNHDKVQFFAFKPISQSVYLLWPSLSRMMPPLTSRCFLVEILNQQLMLAFGWVLEGFISFGWVLEGFIWTFPHGPV